MTSENWQNPPTTRFTDIEEQPSTTDAVKNEAAGVREEAVGAGQHVAGVAKAEAKEVAHEVRQQTSNLAAQVGDDLKSQAAVQQQRVSEGLRSISDELHGMAARSEDDGAATHLVRQAATRASDVATWLNERDPGSLLSEVKGFARRRPGAFLALAAGAGLLAGRLTRGLTAGDEGAGSLRSEHEPALDAQPYPPYPPADFPEPGLTTGAPLDEPDEYGAPPVPPEPPAVVSEPLRGPDPLAGDRPLAGGGLAPGVPNPPSLGQPGPAEPERNRW